jgi:hypothetical protein
MRHYHFSVNRLSKKPLISLNLLRYTVDDPLTSVIINLILCCGRIDALAIRVEEQDPVQESLLALIKEIGNSKLSEVTFECFDEDLFAQILTQPRWGTSYLYLHLFAMNMMIGFLMVLSIHWLPYSVVGY